MSDYKRKPMKPKLLVTAAAILVLSGCSQEVVDPSKSSPKDNVLSDAASRVGKAVDITQKARQNVNDAVQKENSGLAQKELNQSDPTTDMQYVSQYDSAILHTSLGDITVKFYNDASPITVNNFLKLASEKFYDGTRFHRVIKDFMIQGGDPNSKDADRSNDGMGGPGYTFKDEFNKHSLVRGSLAMANSGPNTNGSQFFIVTAASTPWLDGKHTNFGEVTAGMDIIDKIENAKTDASDHPVEDITIKSVDLVKKK